MKKKAIKYLRVVLKIILSTLIIIGFEFGKYSLLISPLISLYFFFIIPGIILFKINLLFSVKTNFLLNRQKNAYVERLLFYSTFSLVFWVINMEIMILFHFSFNSKYLSNLMKIISFLWIVSDFFLKTDTDKFSFRDFKINKSLVINHLNEILCFIFSILIAVLWSVRAPLLIVDDTWYHAAYSQALINNNFIDLKIYNGKFIYHYIGALFSKISGLKIIFIAKWIGIVQVPLATLLFYSLLQSFDIDSSICILSTISFIASPLGNLINFSQFWPTALSSILTIYWIQLIIEKRFKNKKSENSTFNCKGYTIFSYSIEFLLIFSIALVHNTFIFLFLGILIISFLFLTFQDLNYWKNLLFYIVLFSFSSILNFTGFSFFLSFFKKIPIWFFPIILLLLVGLLFLMNKIIKQMTFNPHQNSQDLKKAFNAKGNSSINLEKKFLWKFILPLSFITTSIIYFISDFPDKGFNSANNLITTLNIGFFSVIFALSYFANLIFRYSSKIHQFMYIVYNLVILFIVFLVLFPFPSFLAIRTFEAFLFLAFLSFGLFFHYKFILKKSVLENGIRNKGPSRSLFSRLIKCKFLDFERNEKKLIVMGFFLILLNINVLYLITYQDYINRQDYNLILNCSHFSRNRASNSTEIFMIGNFHYSYPALYLSMDQKSNLNFSHHYAYLLIPYRNWTFSNEKSTIREFNDLITQKNMSDLLFIISSYDVEWGYVGLDGNDYGKIKSEQYHYYINFPWFNRIGINSRSTQIFCYS